MAFYISRFQGVETKTFDIEVVTPMFLGGADPKKAELRVPSIKGALRFWWRAINAHLPLPQLKDQEATLFGDPGDEHGKSKVHLKIDKSINYDGKSTENPVPHRNVPFKFPCLNAGEKFSIIARGDEKIFELLKFVSIVGGIGKRSRRGFGSFRIIKIDNTEISSVCTLQEIQNILQSIMKNTFEIRGDKITRNSTVPQVGYAFIKTIELGLKQESYKDLLKVIGQSSHDNNSDYTGYARGRERFTSPVYISVLKSNEGYLPVVTTLNTAFKNSQQNHGNDTSNKFKKDILSGGAK